MACPTSSARQRQAQAARCLPRSDVEQAEESCPEKHWIEVRLVKEPDRSKRPPWWPSDRLRDYRDEKFTAETPIGLLEEETERGGAWRLDDIPAGACTFEFDRFFDDIIEYFRTKSV
ncbi:MAG: hypothetical protein IT531_07370 [Burkholderiales bacterium]|nr:hypothetical protein [Burkholderiales bacterium]